MSYGDKLLLSKNLNNCTLVGGLDGRLVAGGTGLAPGGRRAGPAAGPMPTAAGGIWAAGRAPEKAEARSEQWLLVGIAVLA
jgi:hypothetical protein